MEIIDSLQGMSQARNIRDKERCGVPVIHALGRLLFEIVNCFYN